MTIINKDTVLMAVCGIALSLGCGGAAWAQQGGGGSAAGRSSGAVSAGGSAAGSGQNAAGAGAMSADTPEDDATLNLTDEQKAQIKTIREDGKAADRGVGEGYVAERRREAAEAESDPEGYPATGLGRDDA